MQYSLQSILFIIIMYLPTLAIGWGGGADFLHKINRDDLLKVVNLKKKSSVVDKGISKTLLWAFIMHLK